MLILKKPASISIYPKNFESKEKVIHFLDTYNHKMEKQIKKTKSLRIQILWEH